MPRRRKRRHRLDPLRYLQPESLRVLFSVGWKVLLAGGAATATVTGRQAAVDASAAVASADSSKTQTGYANANTNALLGILAVVVARVEKDEVRIAKLEQMLGAANMGPAVPPGWVVQPVKKPGWWDRHFRGG